MNKHYRFLWLLVSLTLGLMTTTQAATFTVTTTADGGTGSLRQAITNAQISAGADVIDLTGVTGIISLTSALPDIMDDISFTGPGATLLTVSRSSGTFRIFNIPNNNTVRFDGFTIADGSAGNGGGIHNAGQLTITNCIFRNNQATGNGGGIYNINQLIVTNTLFTGNTATLNGGGILNSGGSSTLTSCSLTSNGANNGGAISNFSSHTATLTNCSLQSNFATQQGGGIYNNGGSSTLTSCSLTNNEATLGGAIHNFSHTATLTNCTLQSNLATNQGGGVYNLGGSSTLTSCSLTGNRANSGGAIFTDGHTATLSNCSLQNNSVTNNGGSILNVGGISTLMSCSLTSNGAANNGGAIYNDGHTATLTNCTLQGNSAAIDGGGIVNVRGSSTLTSCSLTGNRANNGGAILNSNNHTATLTSCSLQSNSAFASGGGIVNSGGSSTLTNCSFQNNLAAAIGGAIYNNNSNPTLTNCVLFGNGDSNTFLNNSSTLTATYSLFEPASVTVTGVNVSGPGNLTTTANPFVSSSSVALAICSPAINAGDPATTPAIVGTTDLAGQARFFNNGRIDMGAIEFQGATTLTVGITVNPGLNILSGQSTTLTASGASSYSWSSAESTSAIVVSMPGPYSVTGITGSCSGTATVTVTVITILPPSITAQPASASTVCAGASVVVTVGVSGSISGYQWLKAGSPVSGQTGPTLSLVNAQVSDAGVYSLSLSGPTGSTTSNGFTLTVNPLPVVTLTIPVGTTAQGASGIALITLPANGFPTTFQASGGSSYERQIILDQINGYAIRQVDSNTNGVFSINRTGLFTLTVMGAGGCSRTVQWVVQQQ